MLQVVAVLALFTGALSPENVSVWECPRGVEVRPVEEGVVLSASPSAATSSRVTYSVDVPEDWRGVSVRQEIDVTSRSAIAWAGEIAIDQYDADGRLLAETVSDWRWTSHMRPAGKLTAYRTPGHVHPRAAKLKLVIELRRPDTAFDAYGEPIGDATRRDPKLLVSHLALVKADDRPAANAGFFVERPHGGFAYRLGGERRQAFSFQTHTRGAWSNARQFREERDLAFPSAAGTVEAWFRLNLNGAPKLEPETFYTLFEGYQGYTTLKEFPYRGTLMHLGYRPGGLVLVLRDWTGKHDYQATFPDVTIADGVWTHVALQWAPGGKAEVFVGGRKAGELAIPEYEAVPIADPARRNPNDLWITELFVGARAQKVKDLESALPEWPILTGAIDSLRASTGTRYDGDFTPDAAYGVDGRTRAYFGFERTYDGTQGTGFGFIPGTVFANESRDANVICGAARPPFDLRNYKRLPTAQEFRAARVPRTWSAQLKPGMRFEVPAADGVRTDSIEIANVGTKPLKHPIVIADGAPDPRSYGDLRESFPFGGRSDREKVDAIFQYLLGASDYFVNRQVRFREGDDDGHCVCNDALVMLNSYCGFECGYLNNLAANLFTLVGDCPAARAAGYGHSFQQVFFDGRNHLYDLANQCCFPAYDDETPASLAQIEDEPGIVARTGTCPNNFLRKGTRVLGGHGATDPCYQAKCALTLNPGERFTLHYANNGHMNNLHYWPLRSRYTGFRLGPDEYDYTKRIGASGKDGTIYRRDRIFPEYSTGVIAFDGRPTPDNPAFAAFTATSFVYRVSSCYPIVWGEYAATRTDGSAVGLSISTDGGKTYRALPSGADGTCALEYLVRARDGYLIRIGAAANEVVRFTARTECEVNPRAYPGWFRDGVRGMTFKATGDGEAQVTYRWREPAGEIIVMGGVHSGAVPGQERQLVALDPSKELSLAVTGAGADAKAVTYGRVKAHLADGKLRLEYDGGRKPLMPRGDDTSDAEEEFPCVAAVDIVDGKRAKTLTVIVQPGVRLIPVVSARPLGGAALRGADGDSPQARLWCAKKGDGAAFAVGDLPPGEYALFALARFDAAAGRETPHFELEGHSLARAINPTEDYYRAQYGVVGGRGRWKWDCGYHPELQLDYNGWIIRNFDRPEGGLWNVRLNADCAEGAELAALLVVAKPGLEARADLRKALFGLNCDPTETER